jgi:methyl-accepting chemotaxis protein
MITQTDISKLKDVFATKKEFSGLDNKVAQLDNKVTQMDKKIDNLADNLQNNTEDLIELITTGFDSLQKSSSRINEQDSILNDHEKRIERIEEKAFKAN